ncbi:O-antigen ligase family protein [Natronorubrum halophilum]|uniref:O-antigen ligase family protein n=1 Tax=Natronorubrum halophilum TaxID=1702106 RepID=UPI0010C1C6C7|nr:O-antigen ligase family protein [Natronorubrum halophilum]
MMDILNEYGEKNGAKTSYYELLVDLIYISLPISLVFSTEVITFNSISQYASINTEDVVILLIVLGFLYGILYRNQRIIITLPNVFAILLATTAWIVVTNTVATFREPTAILMSWLWTFKWFEGIILFVVLQSQLTKRRAYLSLNTLAICGLILAAYSVFMGATGGYRIRIFFYNPNTLSVFLMLIGLIWYTKATMASEYRSIAYFILSMIPLAGIITTGSRAALVGTGTGVLCLIALTWSRLDLFQRTATVGMPLLGLGIGTQIVGTSTINRYTQWIQYTNGQLSLTNDTAARSFRIRLQLIERSFELFQQHPVFGHGWYASPSRIGYLDVHFTTLLAEVGLIGLVIFLIYYLATFMSLFNEHKKATATFATAATAWYCGMIVQSIGGNFPRVPKMMFITLFLLAAVVALSSNRSEPFNTNSVSCSNDD